MLKTNDNYRGNFQIEDAFLLKGKARIYLLGQLIEGKVAIGYFTKLALLEGYMDVYAEIEAIETLIVPNEHTEYYLLLLKSAHEFPLTTTELDGYQEAKTIEIVQETGK